VKLDMFGSLKFFYCHVCSVNVTDLIYISPY